MSLVSAIDVEGVRKILALHDGADIANHKRQLCLGHTFGYAWDEQGMPWPETDPYQPYSPLRLVAFRLSDCCLTLEDFDKFHHIAQLLIDAGADAGDAADYLRQRYGTTSDEADDSDHESSQDGLQVQLSAKIMAFRKVCKRIESAAYGLT